MTCLLTLPKFQFLSTIEVELYIIIQSTHIRANKSGAVLGPESWAEIRITVEALGFREEYNDEEGLVLGLKHFIKNEMKG